LSGIDDYFIKIYQFSSSFIESSAKKKKKKNRPDYPLFSNEAETTKANQNKIFVKSWASD